MPFVFTGWNFKINFIREKDTNLLPLISNFARIIKSEIILLIMQIRLEYTKIMSIMLAKTFPFKSLSEKFGREEGEVDIERYRLILKEVSPELTRKELDLYFSMGLIFFEKFEKLSGMML